MQPVNNVVVIGAGPVGITTACVLKALNAGLNISVIDKRAEPRRNHGLSIQPDSIDKINEILETALQGSVKTDQIKSLKRVLENWGGHFVRTNDIEIHLAEMAKGMGIEVLRDAAYELSEGDLNAFLSPSTPSSLPDNKRKLKSLLTAASVIIAADGAHSTVRTDLGITLADENILKYMVELKYQTEGQTQPRGYAESSFFSSRAGYVALEAINRQTSEDKKPATFLVFIDQETHNSLRKVDDTGRLKGVYGNAWTLKDLQELGRKDERLQNLSKTLHRYLQCVNERGGSCVDEKIVALELKIYRASESVKNFHGKHILLVGDANSGLILQRGFNKGLKEVALCAQAVDKFFRAQSDEAMRLGSGEVPEEFIVYNEAAKELFSREKSAIALKDKGIKVAQFFVGSSASSAQAMEDFSAFSSASSTRAMHSVSQMSSTLPETAGSTFAPLSSLLNWLFPGSRCEEDKK